MPALEFLSSVCRLCKSKANMWRMKFETEAVAKIEEHESAKVKLQARLNEAESTMENLNNKLVILEKTKFSHEKNTEEAKYRVNQSAAKHSQAEKKVKVKHFNQQNFFLKILSMKILYFSTL